VREALAADPRVIIAARMASLFKLDPVECLRSDRATWLIRMASMDVIQTDRTPTDTN
jgi:hypothetical protein